MSLFKRVVFLFVAIICTNASADTLGVYSHPIIDINPEMLTYYQGHYNVPFINFTAQASMKIDGTIQNNVSYYPTWTPDGNGTRPVCTFSIVNTSTSAVTFILTSSIMWSEYYADSRIWALVSTDGSSRGWVNLDDDHGRGSAFGVKVTIAPLDRVVFATSMYASWSSEPWYGIDILPFDTDKENFWLLTNPDWQGLYPELTANGRWLDDITIVRGN